MRPPFGKSKPMRFVCATLLSGILLLSCGLTALAAEEGSPDLPQATPTPTVTTPLPPHPEDMAEEPYPSDVQAVMGDNNRQIIKTYILTAEQSPADIPRDDFERDGWQYTLTDITEKRSSSTDAHNYTETVEISTDTNDLNEIIKMLAPTLDYQSDDGYGGILTLDLSSVRCEAAGLKNSSYTVTATREYPHLSANDLSLIPKTITDNGRTLQLDDVSWEVQQTVNVDYEDIPDSYRAVARYTATASKSVVTGYVTKAAYAGEITKITAGESVYTVYFEGTEINLVPKQAETPRPSAPTATVTPATATPGPLAPKPSSAPIALILNILAFVAVGAGAVSYFSLRRNVRIYREGFKILAAKDRISKKVSIIDLTPLDSNTQERCFGIEIDKSTAKALNGKTIEIVSGSACLQHKVAYEGNTYKIQANFSDMTIQAVY